MLDGQYTFIMYICLHLKYVHDSDSFSLLLYSIRLILYGCAPTFSHFLETVEFITSIFISMLDELNDLNF